MPIETSLYRVESLAKMIKPKANTITVPLVRSKSSVKKDNQYIKANITKLKNHFRT